MRNWATLSFAAALTATVCAMTSSALAAGLLRPQNTADQVPALVDHAVNVVIDNGFARTEVKQIFHNGNASAIDAVYQFPVPPEAALSGVTIQSGDHVLHGEVVDREQAQQVYDAEAAQGAEAGLATQDGYQNFQFSVANIPANGDATLSFVYYEPVSIDTNVGRFLYPLQNGGTDAAAFWSDGETAAAGKFSFDLELKSAAPVIDVRVPEVPGATIQQLGDGHYSVHFELGPTTLTDDVVVYYKLQQDLPGKVELIPYRPATGGPGTFMLLVTPGLDLPTIEHGTDFVYVLDFSGSMESKLSTLKQAVEQALSELGPQDRFRIVGFSDTAFDISQGLLPATPENVSAASATLDSYGTQGGTDLYAGLGSGLSKSDPERVTSVFLVTDGVANEGLVDAKAFDSLLRESDLRVHGFLMGNSANWPLMQVITEASGGFYAAVSNRDDIIGQVQLAKDKLTHESYHDARVELSGVTVSDTTDFDLGKVYWGQQLVVFGRYTTTGDAQVTLHTRLSNQDKAYSASLNFPDVAEGNPELERLWALASIHALNKQALLGLMPQADVSARVRQLGVDYQLVTDETSMLVLDDQAFANQGIARNNQTRSATEQAAQMNGSSSSGNSGGALTPSPSPSTGTSTSTGSEVGSFGGALDPSGIALLLASLLGLGAKRKHALRAR